MSIVEIDLDEIFYEITFGHLRSCRVVGEFITFHLLV